MPWRAALMPAPVLFMLGHQSAFNRGVASVGGSRIQEHRYVDVGRYVDRALPRAASAVRPVKRRGYNRSMSRPAARAVLLVLILLCILWTAAVALTGGVQFHFAGVLIRSRDSFRPLTAAAVLLIVYGFLFREALIRETDALVRVARRIAPFATA